MTIFKGSSSRAPFENFVGISKSLEKFTFFNLPFFRFYRFTNCSIGSCVNPKDRQKKLRNLPARLLDLPLEIRDPIMKELKIPMDAIKCCSACLIRVRRKMITHVLGPTAFTEDEIQKFFLRLREVGPQWSLLAELMGKTIAVLKLFYSFNKKKYGLDQAVNEYYKLHAREDRRPALSDGDESDVSVTSSDDSEHHNAKVLSLSSNSSNLEKQPTTVASSTNATTSIQSGSSASSTTIIPTTTTSSAATTTAAGTTINVTSDLDATNNKTLANNNNSSNNNNNSNSSNSSNLNNNSKTGNVNISNNNSDNNKGMCLIMKAVESNLIPNNNNNNNSKDLRVPTQPPFILSGGLMAVPINNLNNQQQPPLVRNKKQSEDYDSSATETADEENESSPANRQSPKVLAAYNKLPLQSSISMIPQSQMPNGPFSSVRDVIVNVIERGVKNSMNNVAPNKPHKMPMPMIKPQNSNNNQQNSDVTIVGEYRNDSMPMNKNQLRPPPSESLATLSVVNSNPQQTPPQLISQHSIGISPSIAATITPVPPPSQQQQMLQQQQQRAQDNSRLSGNGRNTQMQMNEPEQAFDLSIKKPQQPDRPSFPPPSHTKSIPPPLPGNSAMYRGDPSIQVTNPSQNIFNAGYHHYLDISRHQSKSPQTYIPPVPMSSRVIQQQQQQQQQLTSSPISSQNKSKVAPKLSPKMQTSVTQMNGPKGGSITHGTPLNSSGQPIMIGSSTTLSPRFEAYKQPSPSSGNEKIGSITQGTPVVMPTIHFPDKRSFDYYKNPRQSPAQQSQSGQSQPPPTSSASPHSVQQFCAPFLRQPGSVNAPLYPLDSQPQSQNTKQLLVNDYITSQQMHGQSRGISNSINVVNINSRGDKESPPPRSMVSPAQIYYASDKDRERVATGQTRAEYMSRTSPADLVNR